MHKIKRVIAAAVTGLLIVTIVLSLWIVAKTSLGNEPSILGYRFFYIISGSMEPTVPVGSTVVVHKQNKYDVGDIITFNSRDEAIYNCPNTHRIVDRKDTENGVMYQTQGDANNVPDENWVPLDEVYGRVVFQTPSLNEFGTFLEFLLTPSGFFVVLVIPMLLITVLVMKEFAKNFQKTLRAAAEQAARPSDAVSAEKSQVSQPQDEIITKKEEEEHEQ